MEHKLNIAEILKNKPSGTKLYNLLYNIDVELDTIVTTGTKTIVWCTDKIGNTDVCHRFYSEFGTIEGYPDGLQILLPSKEMRDWNKFAWKKGDILVSDNGKVEVIFEKFVDDTYQAFIGKHHLDNLEDNLYYQDEGEYLTSIFNIESEDAAQTYVKTLEKKLDGQLNHETLKIEKIQPEFKDGDIIVTAGSPYLYYSKCIIILKGDLYTKDNKAHSYAFYNINNKFIDFDIIDTRIRDREIRLATDSEKLQLFDMLTKEGKYWDAEKKKIVDLKLKVKLKPFDKVIVFDELAKKWECGMFSDYSKNDEGKEVITCIGGCTYFKVLPFNEETAKLIGTTKDMEI